MYSQNVTTLLKHITSEGELTLDFEDEIVRETTVAREGEVIHPRIRDLLNLEPIETG